MDEEKRESGAEAGPLSIRSRDDRELDTGALRALAHPLRVQIYDILSQYGPQTASSLAERLGESSGSTSYHLRALARHQLIEEAEGRGSGRERWWQRPEGGISFPTREALETPSGRAATRVVMGEFLRNRQAQLVEFIDRGMTSEEPDWEEKTLISTANTRLTPDQCAELSEKVMAVIDEAVNKYRHQTGEGVRAVTIRADIFPLPEIGESS